MLEIKYPGSSRQPVPNNFQNGHLLKILQKYLRILLFISTPALYVEYEIREPHWNCTIWPKVSVLVRNSSPWRVGLRRGKLIAAFPLWLKSYAKLREQLPYFNHTQSLYTKRWCASSEIFEIDAAASCPYLSWFFDRIVSICWFSINSPNSFWSFNPATKLSDYVMVVVTSFAQLLVSDQGLVPLGQRPKKMCEGEHPRRRRCNSKKSVNWNVQHCFRALKEKRWDEGRWGTGSTIR